MAASLYQHVGSVAYFLDTRSQTLMSTGLEQKLENSDLEKLGLGFRGPTLLPVPGCQALTYPDHRAKTNYLWTSSSLNEAQDSLAQAFQTFDATKLV